ncbi:MAG: hypothetical protein DRI65_10205 [Chloroflexota bacterium]|nr:MAG: hypothetical protein DRI65_10205 [Chloroflexota bacterium]
MEWLKDRHKDTIYFYRIIRTSVDELEHLDSVVGGPPSYWEHFLDEVPKYNPGEILKFGDFEYQYAGFEGKKLGGMTKVVYEKNGRKALKISTDGKHSYRSMTKDNYINGKGTDEVLTKGCAETSNKEKQKILHNKMEQFKRGTK